MLQPVIQHLCTHILLQLLNLVVQSVRTRFSIPDRFDGNIGVTEIRFMEIEDICPGFCNLAEIGTSCLVAAGTELAETLPDHLLNQARICISYNNQNHVVRTVPGVIVLPEQF